MKKGIALLLATLMCLSLTACGGTGKYSFILPAPFQAQR